MRPASARKSHAERHLWTLPRTHSAREEGDTGCSGSYKYVVRLTACVAILGVLEPLSAAAPWAIFPRKKLDVTYGDVVAGLQACFTLRESERTEYEHRLTQHWDPTGHSVVTLSVRCVTMAGGCVTKDRERETKTLTLWRPCMVRSSSTGFDLLLQTLKLPRGSEVLCSAVTIPDMLYLLRFHGLVAVPVDLDPETLAVDVDALQRSVTANTRAVLITYVFGSRFSMDRVLDLADELNLLVIEVRPSMPPCMRKSYG